MSLPLEGMYQEVLLSHYRAPHGRRPLPHATARGEHRNPLCGDAIAVAVRLADDVIDDVAFEGRGCSIATASASMLTGAVRGLSVADAAALADRVEAVVGGAADQPPLAGDLAALAGVAPFPQRHGCALMPWQALRDALDEARRTAAAPTSAAGGGHAPDAERAGDAR